MVVVRLETGNSVKNDGAEKTFKSMRTLFSNSKTETNRLKMKRIEDEVKRCLRRALKQLPPDVDARRLLNIALVSFR